MFEKNRLYLLVCFDRFLPFSAFASCWFLFEFFWGIEIFEGSATISSVLMEVLLVLELNLKTYYLECTNVANKDCVKFCMKENFQVYGRNE